MVALLHVKRYLFDREFHQLADIPFGANGEDDSSEAAEEQVPEPPQLSTPAFSEADVEAAREIAFAEGQQAGRTVAERSTAARTATVLAAIADQLHDATASAARQQTVIIRDATALALAICRKLLPQTYRDAAGEEITGLLSRTLPRISDQSQVLIRVAVVLVEEISQSVANAVETAGFTGTAKVIGDESLAEGDCRIEWAQGGLTRDATTLLLEIESLIAEAVGGSTGADGPHAHGAAIESLCASPNHDPELADPSVPTAETVDANQRMINPSQRAKEHA